MIVRNLLIPSYKRPRFDLFASVLLAIGMVDAAYQVYATQWADYLYINLTIVLFGTMVGLAVGSSRFKRCISVLLLTGYGFFVIGWQLVNTFDDQLTWLERTGKFISSLGQAFVEMSSGEMVTTVHLFLLVMAILFWALSAIAGYLLIRHQLHWVATIPTAIMMLVVSFYGDSAKLSVGYFVFFIVVMLIIVARMTYIKRFTYWERKNLYVPELTNSDLTRISIALVAVIVIGSWLLPTAINALPSATRVYSVIRRPWNAMQEKLEIFFAPLNPSIRVIEGFYDDSKSLGRGNPLSSEILLTVQTMKRTAPGIRFYWRARMYDTYQNGNWFSSNITSTIMSSENMQLNVEDSTNINRWSTVARVIPNDILSTLFIPNNPTWISAPVISDFQNSSDGHASIAAVHSSPQLIEDEEYFVKSNLTKTTITNLRNAGEDYPDWVAETYLQLPDSITNRTKELSHEITYDLETPYDKVSAITRFLRSHLEYNSSIPNIPEGFEPIDWLLFEHRKGFCNYYASAEVIMLRSIGIPARFVSGYSQGDLVTSEELELSNIIKSEVIPDEWNDYRGQYEYYLIRERHAHSWVEVYFPGTGWVEFEPTINQAALVRPLGGLSGTGPINAPDLPEIDEPIPDSEIPLNDLYIAQEFDFLRSKPEAVGDIIPQRFPWERYVFLSLIIVGILIILFTRQRVVSTVPVLVERGLLRMNISPPQFLKNWAYYSTQSPLNKGYQSINSALKRLGEQPGPDATPSERGSILAHQLPDAKEEVNLIIGTYSAARYGNKGEEMLGVRPAVSVIKKETRRLMFREKIPQRIKQIFSKANKE